MPHESTRSRSSAIRPADDLTDWMEEGPTQPFEGDPRARTAGLDTMECVLGSEKPLAEAEALDLLALHEELFKLP